MNRQIDYKDTSEWIADVEREYSYDAGWLVPENQESMKRSVENE